MLGILALTNVVIRAVLTAPGPFNLIHAEVPNLMMGTFPFLFIPGFFVPLAVVLHALAIRAVSSRLSTAISGAVSSGTSDRAGAKETSSTPYGIRSGCPGVRWRELRFQG